ncbi:MAG TPA: hypothetical protein VIF62_23915 [Labilithrix sp.]|jgi:hypothetical protein
MGEPVRTDEEGHDATIRPSGVREPLPRTTTRNSVDGWVPKRTGKEPPQDLDLRLAFVLLHADGAASVGEIAQTVQRPPLDVLASFVELSSLGLVDLGST